MNTTAAASRVSLPSDEADLIADAIGIELQGIIISGDMPEAHVQRIKDGLRDHLVVRCRAQKLRDTDLLAFSRRLGDLDPPGPNPYGAPFLPDTPEINVISNVVQDGKPVGNLGAGEAVWHADMTYIEVPPRSAVLYALEIPPDGGGTYFASMIAAYEAMPSHLKQAIEGKRAVHDASLNSAGMLRKGYQQVA